MQPQVTETSNVPCARDIYIYFQALLWGKPVCLSLRHVDPDSCSHTYVCLSTHAHPCFVSYSFYDYSTFNFYFRLQKWKHFELQIW